MQIREHSPEVSLRSLLSDYGKNLVGYREISRGENSRVYLLQGDEGNQYVAKFYPPPEPGRLDRLQIEYSTLVFLREHGFENVPEPLLRCDERSQALFGYLRGERPTCPSLSDLHQVANFFCRLQTLREKPHADQLPEASEACFSLGQHARLVHRRINLLREALTPQDGEVERFLDLEFLPFVTKVEERVDLSTLLPDRVLSPSDFGFHNSLRDHRGKLHFLDFEYFGWDDLSKVLVDFSLHPQHRELGPLSRKFHELVRNGLPVQPGFDERLQQVEPFCGAKWCLIMLNVFRRRHRAHPPASPSLLARRLISSRQLLALLKRRFSL